MRLPPAPPVAVSLCLMTSDPQGMILSCSQSRCAQRTFSPGFRVPFLRLPIRLKAVLFQGRRLLRRLAEDQRPSFFLSLAAGVGNAAIKPRTIEPQ